MKQISNFFSDLGKKLDFKKIVAFRICKKTEDFLLKFLKKEDFKVSSFMNGNMHIELPNSKNLTFLQNIQKDILKEILEIKKIIIKIRRDGNVF